MSSQHHSTRTDLLAWYLDMGVDAAVADEPADWFARGATAGRTARKPQPAAPAARPARPQSPRFKLETRPHSETQADAGAAQAASLEELRAVLQYFDGCPLKATAKNLCFSRGSPAARLMLIGEGPGRDEDLQGRPFVGRAGQLLDKMLSAIDLGEDQVYITNIVYWRPPGNRTPTPQEVLACAPFLERQIELVDPDVLVFLGGAAAKQMFDTSEGIMRLRGKWRDLKAGGRERRAIATLHPAYLLRNPSAKRLAWRDLLEIDAALKN
jgi:DNA polymerase